MTRIYIIRHAEAEGNLYRRIHGWYNSRLTETGLAQLEYLQKRFEGIRLDAVYSSDLKRTCLTAQAVACNSGLDVKAVPDLREVCMGVWEDKTWGEVGCFDREQYINFSSKPDSWHVEGSEAFNHLQDRMECAVLKIAAQNDGKTIACATHGYAIRALLCRIMGLSGDDICRVDHCDNTGVTLLEVENGIIHIIYHNDASHIPGTLTRFRNQTWWKNKDGNDSSVLWFKASDTLANGSSCCSESYIAMQGNAEIGYITLDKGRGSDSGSGFITGYYLSPEHRGKKLSVQLLGQAVSVCRTLKRQYLVIDISPSRQKLISYFRHYGFKDAGPVSDKLRMKLDISLNQEFTCSAFIGS